MQNFTWLLIVVYVSKELHLEICFVFDVDKTLVNFCFHLALIQINSWEREYENRLEKKHLGFFSTFYTLKN